MRKQNIGYLFDKIFWYTLYMLPIFIMLIFKVDFNSSFDMLELNIDNIIFTNLNALFGLGGVLPFGNCELILKYLSYFVFLNIIHLAVDVLLFIVRWCHKMLRKGEDYVED